MPTTDLPLRRTSQEQIRKIRRERSRALSWTSEISRISPPGGEDGARTLSKISRAPPLGRTPAAAESWMLLERGGKEGSFRRRSAPEQGRRARRPGPVSQSLSLFQRKASRLLKGEDRNKVGSSTRSLGLDTSASQPADGRSPLEGGPLSPSRECWTKEERPPAQSDSFLGFSSSDSVLRELDDGQLDQEEGVTQVTCM